MEKLTGDFANKIAEELKLDDDNKAVVAYGIFALTHIVLSVVLVIIFGLIFHVIVEALIICFTGSILRKYSGGVHASSPGTCATIGTIVCIGLALIFSFIIGSVINIGVLIFIGSIIFVLSYYLVYKLAPVDSPAKPIRTKEKKVRMKKGSIFILSAYIIIVMINITGYLYFNDNRFLIYCLCIYGGVAWQVFTLTRVGYSTVNKMDTFLNQILKLIKRGK